MRNTTSISNRIVTTLIGCLILIQLSAAQAQDTTSGPHGQAPAVQVSASSLTKLMDLAYRIQRHPILYKYLNKVFSDFLVISEARQKQMGWPEKSKGLSESQLVFLLSTKPRFAVMANQYLSAVNPDKADAPKIEKLREQMRNELTELLAKDAEWKERMIKFADPTMPLNISLPRLQPGYQTTELFVNHPHVADGNNPQSEILPGQDLKRVVLDFISQAKSEVWYNVFDFDLKDVAQALVDANSRGVSVIGGIDNETIETRPEVKEIFDFLQKSKSENFQTVSVDSVGLNHMKVIVRDAGTPYAATLFLSGNFTQSCIGPEGDLVNLTFAQRPKGSVPNANHAVLIQGDLPAVIARQHLKKILVDKLRGQSDFPINGAYRVIGNVSVADRVTNWITISFSPNGGMGNVNSDVLRQFILGTKGPLRALLFAFSSPNLVEAINLRAKNEAERSNEMGRYRFDFAAVGDTPFAMRDWSGLLKISGLQQDIETKKYSSVMDYDLRNVTGKDNFAVLQSQIRTAPTEYRMGKVTIDGESYDLSAKLHHKVWVAPMDRLSVLGTSFNPSENAESNNEQILIIRDDVISEKAMGMFYGLYNRSKGSVIQVAERRNSIEYRDDGIVDREIEGKKKKTEIQKKQKPVAVLETPRPIQRVRVPLVPKPRSTVRSCEMVYR